MSILAKSISTVLKFVFVIAFFTFSLYFVNYAISYISLYNLSTDVCRIVSTTNCLDDTISFDNGSGVFITDRDIIDNKANAIDTNLGFLELDSDYFESPDIVNDIEHAPQRGVEMSFTIKGRLTGTVVCFVPLNINLPIEIERTVIGTKFYRDRG